MQSFLMSHQETQPVIQSLSCYLDTYFSQIFFDHQSTSCNKPHFYRKLRFSVGFSAGEDSSVLLIGLALLREQYGFELEAVHVHHSLMADADEWVARANRLCEQLNVRSHTLYIQVDKVHQKQYGLESAARQKRYEALTSWFQTHHIKHHFLAHHQKDQLETLLFRLFRGSGSQGLQGMAVRMQNEGGVWYERPLLRVSKADIHRAMNVFSSVFQWLPVQDPSNADLYYARAKIRHQVIPLLDNIFPAWSSNFLKFSTLISEQEAYLEQLMGEKLASVSNSKGIVLSQWRSLEAFEKKSVLRLFLKNAGLHMPSKARLDEWVRQFDNVHQMGTDRQVQHRHDGVVLKICDGVIIIES